jgi:hypothetical protein
MPLTHLSLGKIAYVAANAFIVAFYAIDPSVKVAWIGLGGVLVTNLCALAMFYMKLRAGQEKMQGSIDGKLDTLIDAKGRLAHAEGRQQGSDEERARDKT